eukprot:1139671-Pelagomonas_calceolata.AAC.2
MSRWGRGLFPCSAALCSSAAEASAAAVKSPAMSRPSRNEEHYTTSSPVRMTERDGPEAKPH